MIKIVIGRHGRPIAPDSRAQCVIARRESTNENTR